MPDRHNPDTESVRLPKHLTDKARVLAKAEHRTLSGMIVHAWEEFLRWREHIKDYAARLARQQQRKKRENDNGERD